MQGFHSDYVNRLFALFLALITTSFCGFIIRALSLWIQGAFWIIVLFDCWSNTRKILLYWELLARTWIKRQKQKFNYFQILEATQLESLSWIKIKQFGNFSGTHTTLGTNSWNWYSISWYLWHNHEKKLKGFLLVIHKCGIQMKQTCAVGMNLGPWACSKFHFIFLESI